jgi:hypothetical protein
MAERTSRRRLSLACAVLLALGGSGAHRCTRVGTVYVLTPESRIEQGCFPPRDCPAVGAEVRAEFPDRIDVDVSLNGGFSFDTLIAIRALRLAKR